MNYYYKNDEGVWVATTTEEFGRKNNLSLRDEQHEEFGLFRLQFVEPTVTPTSDEYVDYGDIEDDEGRPARVGIVKPLSEEVKQERFKNTKATMKAAVSELYSRAMQVISESYPKEEREGWPEQIEAATAVIDGSTGTILEDMASVRGLSEQEMANRVLSKRELYRQVYGAMTANLHRLTVAIETATTFEELNTLDLSSGWSLN